eukprot:PhM_4_TR15947/c0_g3_i2/m.50137
MLEKVVDEAEREIQSSNDGDRPESVDLDAVSKIIAQMCSPTEGASVGGDLSKFGDDLQQPNANHSALKCLEIYASDFKPPSSIEEAMRSVGILRGADYAMCCLTHSDNAAHPCHVVCGASNVVAHLKTNHSTDERVKNLLASTSGLKSDLTLDELNDTVGGSGLFKHPTVDDILHKGTVFWQRFEADGLPRTYPSITRDCAIALYLYTLETELYRDMNYALRVGVEETINRFGPLIHFIEQAFTQLPKHDLMVSQLYRGLDINLEATYSSVSFVRWTAFSSTTASHTVVHEFLKSRPGQHSTEGTIFLIRSRNGILISDFSEFPKEDEVLLPPNSLLKIGGEVGTGTKELLSRQLGLPLSSVYICEVRDATNTDVQEYYERLSAAESNLWLQLTGGENIQLVQKLIPDVDDGALAKESVSDWADVKREFIVWELFRKLTPKTRAVALMRKCGPQCAKRHDLAMNSSAVRQCRRCRLPVPRGVAATCLCGHMCLSCIQNFSIGDKDAVEEQTKRWTTSVAQLQDAPRGFFDFDKDLWSVLVPNRFITPEFLNIVRAEDRASVVLRSMDATSNPTKESVDEAYKIAFSTSINEERDGDEDQQPLRLGNASEWSRADVSLCPPELMKRLAVDSKTEAWYSLVSVRCNKHRPITYTASTSNVTGTCAGCGKNMQKDYVGPACCPTIRYCVRCFRGLDVDPALVAASDAFLSTYFDTKQQLKISVERLHSIPNAFFTDIMFHTLQKTDACVVLGRLLQSNSVNVAQKLTQMNAEPMYVKIALLPVWELAAKVHFTPSLFAALDTETLGYVLGTMIAARCPSGDHLLEDAYFIITIGVAAKQESWKCDACQREVSVRQFFTCACKIRVCDNCHDSCPVPERDVTIVDQLLAAIKSRGVDAVVTLPKQFLKTPQRVFLTRRVLAALDAASRGSLVARVLGDSGQLAARSPMEIQELVEMCEDGSIGLSSFAIRSIPPSHPILGPNLLFKKTADPAVRSTIFFVRFNATCPKDNSLLSLASKKGQHGPETCAICNLAILGDGTPVTCKKCHTNWCDRCIQTRFVVPKETYDLAQEVLLLLNDQCLKCSCETSIRLVPGGILFSELALQKLETNIRREVKELMITFHTEESLPRYIFACEDDLEQVASSDFFWLNGAYTHHLTVETCKLLSIRSRSLALGYWLRPSCSVCRHILHAPTTFTTTCCSVNGCGQTASLICRECPQGSASAMCRPCAQNRRLSTEQLEQLDAILNLCVENERVDLRIVINYNFIPFNAVTSNFMVKATATARGFLMSAVFTLPSMTRERVVELLRQVEGATNKMSIPSSLFDARPDLICKELYSALAPESRKSVIAVLCAGQACEHVDHIPKEVAPSPNFQKCDRCGWTKTADHSEERIPYVMTPCGVKICVKCAGALPVAPERLQVLRECVNASPKFSMSLSTVNKHYALEAMIDELFMAATAPSQCDLFKKALESYNHILSPEITKLFTNASVELSDVLTMKFPDEDLMFTPDIFRILKPQSRSGLFARRFGINCPKNARHILAPHVSDSTDVTTCCLCSTSGEIALICTSCEGNGLICKSCVDAKENFVVDHLHEMIEWLSVRGKDDPVVSKMKTFVSPVDVMFPPSVVGHKEFQEACEVSGAKK